MKPKIAIFGGGCFNHIRSHLALATPAFGTSARKMFCYAFKTFPEMEVNLYLTKMADPQKSKIVTNDDLMREVLNVLADINVKSIIFNAAPADYNGHILDGSDRTESGKYETRLQTSFGQVCMALFPKIKIVNLIKEARPDIFLASFKTTSGEDLLEMKRRGLNQIEKTQSDIVLVNDIKTRQNLVLYKSTKMVGLYDEDRQAALENLTYCAGKR